MISWFARPSLRSRLRSSQSSSSTATAQILETRNLLAAAPLPDPTVLDQELINPANTNDTPETAQLLFTTTALDPIVYARAFGTISQNSNPFNGATGDRFDYYRFTLHQTQTLRFDLSSSGIEDLRLRIISQNGQQFAFADVSGTRDEALNITLSNFAVPGGDYFIEVRFGNPDGDIFGSFNNFDSRFSSYNLTVVTSDPDEFNDTDATAINLGTLSTSTPSISTFRSGRNIGYGVDFVDLYKFVVTDRMTAQGSISLENLDDNANLEVIGPNGFLVASTNPGTTSEVITLPRLEIGTYLIRVTLATPGIAVNYSLSVNLAVDQLSGTPDNNDTRVTATDLGTLQPSSPTLSRSIDGDIGYRGDINDFYKFTVSGVNNVNGSIVLRNLAADANVALTLPNGTILRMFRSGTLDETLTLTNLASGTYMIRVFRANLSVLTTYTLDVNVSSLPVLDRNGVNNSLAQAIPLGVARTANFYATKSDNVGRTGDTSDVYKFEVAAGRKAKFRLELSIIKAAVANGLTVQLLNASGQAIPLTQVIRGNKRTLTLAGAPTPTLAAGTYFLRFLAPAGSDVDYRFQLFAETLQDV